MAYPPTGGEQPYYAPPPGPPPQHLRNSYPNGYPPQAQTPAYSLPYGGHQAHAPQPGYGQQPSYGQQPQYAPQPSYGQRPHSAQYSGYGQPSQHYQQPGPPQHHQQPHGQPAGNGQYLSPAQQSGQSSPSGHGRRPSHGGSPRPSGRRTGFAMLPPRFHIWNSKRGESGSSYIMEIGPQPFGEVVFSSKMNSSGTNKFKAGHYSSGGASVGEARDKNFVSSKSVLVMNGKETILDGGASFSSSARWKFDAPVNGKTEQLEWRKKPAGSLTARLLASDKKIGNWELHRRGGSGSSPLATWTSGKGSGFEKNTELGHFEFHGPAATGGLGDEFTNLAILSMLRMLQQHFQTQVIKAVASAG